VSIGDGASESLKDPIDEVEVAGVHQHQAMGKLTFRQRIIGTTGSLMNAEGMLVGGDVMVAFVGIQKILAHDKGFASTLHGGKFGIFQIAKVPLQIVGQGACGGADGGCWQGTVVFVVIWVILTSGGYGIDDGHFDLLSRGSVQ